MSTNVIIVSYGDKVERRVRQIAAILGVPEFVYGQPLIRKGSAVREVSDGILLCGGGGAILQVKSRSRREGRNDSAEEAERWVKKHVERAVRQGRGSRRTIRAYQNANKPLSVTPVRIMTVSEPERSNSQVVLNTDCSDWPVVVVIDHPSNPSVVLPIYDNTFCISLHDWRTLNENLRSTHDTLRYIRDVIDSQPDVSVPLGYESDRFASRVDLDRNFSTGNARAKPWTSYAAREDPLAVAAYRELLDRTWGENDELPGFPIRDYRAILDFLDDAPVVTQVYVGRWIQDRWSELRSRGHRISGATLIVDRPLVLLIDFSENCPSKNDWLALLWGLTATRAVEWRTQMNRRQNVLGIGVRVMDGDFYEYTYALMYPDISIPQELVRQTEWVFGAANFKTFQTRQLKVGRNEVCPCGSDRKFKRCHGSGERQSDLYPDVGHDHLRQ